MAFTDKLTSDLKEFVLDYCTALLMVVTVSLEYTCNSHHKLTDYYHVKCPTLLVSALLHVSKIELLLSGHNGATCEHT